MKLGSLVLICCGSLLAVSVTAAQEPVAQEPVAQEPVAQAAGPQESGYATGPVAAQPAASSGGGGGIKDNGPHQRPMMGSAQIYTPWRFGFGFGLKLGFEIPLVHNGFIPQINNSFSIEPNFALAWNNYNRGYGYYGGGIFDDNVSAMEYTPGVSVLWSFYFSERFRAYAAIHLGVTILKPYWTGDDDVDGEFKTYTRFHGELAPGIVYMLSDRVGLRAELGWWSGAKFGVAVAL